MGHEHDMNTAVVCDPTQVSQGQERRDILKSEFRNCLCNEYNLDVVQSKNLDLSLIIK